MKEIQITISGNVTEMKRFLGDDLLRDFRVHPIKKVNINGKEFFVESIRTTTGTPEGTVVFMDLVSVIRKEFGVYRHGICN